MAKFVVMLRVKDGIFFAEEWLECFEKLADEIVVLDNGSTDGTYEMLKKHPKVVDIIRTEGYNEGRDKNLLYDHVRLRKPDWCLWIDIDEIFEPGLTRAHFDKLMESKLYNKFAFRRFHFTDREHFAGSWYRLNYSSGHDRIMWRENPAGHFQDLIIDSPNVKGIKGLKKNTNFRLKHLGYINKELVDKKAEIYRAIIPEKEEIFQSMYLTGERPIKWIDDRKNYKVILLNNLLSTIQIFHLFPKVARRVKKIFA
ncbi:glycosyltransferase family 2 protein [Pedobacter mucosus]|uniref:glycosyltransferase family 2 protein n=1 Tax=Pedobacter mucosus TaxID=2895286 RepID=UPI001EE4AB88|nr:glycosyltransferase family 2 protein [Pedobacter mucosus]UKT62399.1 glycosyltransferase family 2 protein [Pedobacter mucosus]